MLICTLNTIIIGILHNTMHINMFVQTYQNTYCHCHCMSHTMTQKSYRNHSPPQHTRYVSHTKKTYYPRVNKFANVECFYCMTKGHTSNVCYYRKLHLNMLLWIILKLTNLGQERFGFKRMYKLCFVGVLEVHKNKK